MQKIIFYLIIPIISMVNLNAQCKYGEDTIMKIRGKWSQYPDENLVLTKNLPKILRRMDKIGLLIKAANPIPLGTEAIWYRAMINVPMVENGPQNYYCASLYKYWYCNLSLNELQVAGETSTWAEIYLNSLKGFLPRLQDHKLQLDSQELILLPRFNGEWKGFPMVIDTNQNFGEKVVVITHNRQFPWKAVSRQQYLMVLKKKWQDQKVKTREGYAEAIADLEKSIKEWKENNTIKEADKAPIIKSLKEGIQDYKEKSGPQTQLNHQYCDNKIVIIDDYLKKHPDDLQKPAIIDIYLSPVDDFTGQFGEEIRGGRQLVVLDPSYFNKKFSDDVPQLMVLRWRWNSNAPGIHFKNEFEKKFSFEKLVEMIDQLFISK